MSRINANTQMAVMTMFIEIDEAVRLCQVGDRNIGSLAAFLFCAN